MPPVRIPACDLRPGMYLVDTGADWQKEPFLYSHEGVVKSMGEIATILEQGYTEAYYDPDQSQIEAAEEVSVPDGVPSAFSPPTATLAEEMPMAEKAYSDCVTHVRTFMQNVRKDGKVQLGQAEPLVTTIISSLNRNMDALTSLAKVKAYDVYTFEHCVNVAIYATAFGRFLGLGEQQLLLLGMAGIFHDTGKMLVPQDILQAPRRLTPDEFEIMKTHVQRGIDCLGQSNQLPPAVIAGVVQHHEKANGAGYPNGIGAAQISPFGRVMSVADIFDALTAKRVYKDPIPCAKALSIMYNMRGETWEEGTIERFIKMLGIYPVGTPVLLASGFRGVVSRSNPAAPLRPTLLVIRDPHNKPVSPPREIDLAKFGDVLIKRALTTSEAAGIDVAALLGCGQDGN